LQSAKEDQAGGVVRRRKGGDDDCVARERARERRVAVLNGARRPQDPQGRRCASRCRPVHTLRDDFAGTKISVSLNGKRSIDFARARQRLPVHSGDMAATSSISAAPIEQVFATKSQSSSGIVKVVIGRKTSMHGVGKGKAVVLAARSRRPLTRRSSDRRRVD
jgi:hypothetical protein